MDLMKVANEELAKLDNVKNAKEKNYPEFKAGDTITISYKIKEGDKERIQGYRGVVIQCNGEGNTATFTVRKTLGTFAVERIFPIILLLSIKLKLTNAEKLEELKYIIFVNLAVKKQELKKLELANNIFTPLFYTDIAC